ncbi:MAG: hypothetical protein J6V53_02630 [Alphaproteobacteria bacterium]|nr:hypothetical protein [Alphaproteobacteria bacterium]
MKYLLLMSFFLMSACSSFQGDFFDTSSRFNRVQKREFVGRSAGEVVNVLGTPRTVLTEEPNQVWTYRKDKCITFVYFDKSGKVGFAEERGECVNLDAFEYAKENKNETESNT